MICEKKHPWFGMCFISVEVLSRQLKFLCMLRNIYEYMICNVTLCKLHVCNTNPWFNPHINNLMYFPSKRYLWEHSKPLILKPQPFPPPWKKVQHIAQHLLSCETFDRRAWFWGINGIYFNQLQMIFENSYAVPWWTPWSSAYFPTTLGICLVRPKVWNGRCTWWV